VIGPIHPASKTGHFEKGAISLAINVATSGTFGPIRNASPATTTERRLSPIGSARRCPAS